MSVMDDLLAFSRPTIQNLVPQEGHTPVHAYHPLHEAQSLLLLHCAPL